MSNLLRKVIAVDTNYAERIAKSLGFRYLPVAEIIQAIGSNNTVDVIECLATVVERVPEDETHEALANVVLQYRNKAFALSQLGVRVIRAPAKPLPDGGYKQSDDQALMIAALSTALRLQPDFLTLFAADGDFAPMVNELRYQGIRTELVARETELASELKAAAGGRVLDYQALLETFDKA